MTPSTPAVADFLGTCHPPLVSLPHLRSVTVHFVSYKYLFHLSSALDLHGRYPGKATTVSLLGPCTSLLRGPRQPPFSSQNKSVSNAIRSQA